MWISFSGGAVLAILVAHQGCRAQLVSPSASPSLAEYESSSPAVVEYESQAPAARLEVSSQPTSPELAPSTAVEYEDESKAPGIANDETTAPTGSPLGTIIQDSTHKPVASPSVRPTSSAKSSRYPTAAPSAIEYEQPIEYQSETPSASHAPGLAPSVASTMEPTPALTQAPAAFSQGFVEFTACNNASSPSSLAVPTLTANGVSIPLSVQLGTCQCVLPIYSVALTVAETAVLTPTTSFVVASTSPQVGWMRLSVLYSGQAQMRTLFDTSSELGGPDRAQLNSTSLCWNVSDPGELVAANHFSQTTSVNFDQTAAPTPPKFVSPSASPYHYVPITISSGTNTGAIAGGVVGGLLGLSALSMACVWRRYERRMTELRRTTLPDDFARPVTSGAARPDNDVVWV